MTDELTKVTTESARGGFFLFSGATVATAVMAISAILIGNILGPSLYGQYTLVLVIPSLLLLFTDFGINAGVTKFVASLRAKGQEERVPVIIRQGLLFRLSIAIALSIFSIVFANYFSLIINRPDSAFYIQIASLSVVFQVIFTTTNSAFVGLDQAQYSALSNNIQAIMKTVFQIILLIFSFSLTGVLIGYIGGFAVASVLGAVILFSKFLKPKPVVSSIRFEKEESLQTLKVLTKYGLPLYFSVVMLGLFPLYQQVVLAFFTTDAAIGNFKAASNFVTLLTVIPTAITTTLLPAFSKLESSPVQVSEFFSKANKYSCLLMLPATTLVAIFSKQIVELIYTSPSYSSAALYLTASVLIYYLVGAGFLGLTSLFNGIGKTRLTLKFTSIYFSVTIILSPFLAQIYGIIGVIVAHLIAGALATIYGAYIATKQLKIKFDFAHTSRIYLATLLSCPLPLVFLLRTSFPSIITLVLGTTFFLLVYITLIPLLNVVGKSELSVLGRVIQGVPLLRVLAKPMILYQYHILQLAGKN
ncbi:MAG: oligosaccharide flippase family protein [Candidatus Bathyarchaeota archaeon]|nr:oligosaccharide flippase family protein [Candidatus Bathyarchaeota archaeon]